MDNDTRGSRRLNLLLRRVVVPSWMQVLLLATCAFVVIKVVVAHPLLVGAAAVAYVCISFAIACRLRFRRGRVAVDYDEIRSAASMQAALTIAWRQMRTYPVWLLAVLMAAMVYIVLGYLGVPLP